MSEADNKTSDKNVANIEDDVEILESIVKVHNDFLQGVNKESINEKEIRALEHLLSHYKNMKFNYENLIHDISLIAESLGMQEDSTIEEIAIRISEEMYNQQQINEEHQRINGELREKVKELEEENKNLKAQHIFTRNNNATDKEKAELYDVIDKTIDTFLEQEKPIWQQEMIKDKMSLEEALSIVDEMYQNKYKIIEKNNTIYVDKLNDIKFTSLEFASVRLLREVQSLQYKLENSIPKQVVKEVLQNNRNELFGMTYLSKEQYRLYEMQIERINKIEQELLEGEK